MNEQERHEIRRTKARKRLAMTQTALAYDYPKLNTYAGILPAGTAKVDRVTVFDPDDHSQFYITTMVKFQGGSLDVISAWRGKQ